MEPPECLSYSSSVRADEKGKESFHGKNFGFLFKKIDYWLTINCMLITIQFVLVLGERLMSKSIISYAV